MINRSLHSALKAEPEGQIDTPPPGVTEFKLMRLTHGEHEIDYSLHARPREWTSSGVQSADLLALLGFGRGRCLYMPPECYSARVPTGYDLGALTAEFPAALRSLREADASLGACGLAVPRPEGHAYYYGRSCTSRGETRSHRPRHDGHTAAKSRVLSTGHDDFFHFALTWIEDADAAAWVFHYVPTNPPLSREMEAGLEFIGGFHAFKSCPEFQFAPCVYRLVPWSRDHRDRLACDRLADTVNSTFKAHETHFSDGLRKLLDAHVASSRIGFSLLDLRPEVRHAAAQPQRPAESHPASRGIVASSVHGLPDSFDVAVSFAGAQREQAERLSNALRDSNVAVFYDHFYPEHLWGRDLVVLFEEIYSRRSRFCVVFVSKEYIDGPWTTHERQCAQSKALEQRGREYILPVKVDGSDLPGMPATIGYINLSDFSIEQIASMLVRKVTSERQRQGR